jgi:lysine-specific permease
MAAGEAENPTKSIPKAIRACFWRIVFFFISIIFFIGLCIPYTEPRFSFAGNSPSTSAFTLIFEKAGISAGAHIINAIILVR